MAAAAVVVAEAVVTVAEAGVAVAATALAVVAVLVIMTAAAAAAMAVATAAGGRERQWPERLRTVVGCRGSATLVTAQSKSLQPRPDAAATRPMHQTGPDHDPSDAHGAR